MQRPSVTRLALVGGGVVAILLAIAGWPVARHQFIASGERGATIDTSDVTPEVVSKGRGIFHGVGNCAVCHGQRLEGGVGPTLLNHAWKDAKGGDLPAIYAVVTHGVANTAMVAHPGGINDTQALQVASYVWAVGREKAKP